MARRRRLIPILLLLLIAAAGVALWAVAGDRYAGFNQPVLLEIPRRTSTRDIAALLAEKGVVRSEWQFLAARALRPSAVLQAGEYRFAAPDTPYHVATRLAAGDVHYYQVTVPEGANIFEIAATLDTLGLDLNSRRFLEAVRRPALVKELIGDLSPQAASLEGYLFPSTYRLTRATSAEQMVRQMTSKFRAEWKSLGAPKPVHQTVTLASLVEKESAVPRERPLVASVYRNRLDAGMKLDCDPTTIYAALLEGRWRGTIYRSDLDSPHPYNTYRNPGLPPGPIANPGAESLRAALKPAQTSYLFFVAKPDGSGQHTFTSDLNAHNQAVAQYRSGNHARQP
ncbi:MAG: endolytic transglycosylase MltG [Bryobacteraceae bacterium]|nr:endolytic transglycosylase MltG [Bryobacteraceae bacterium]